MDVVKTPAKADSNRQGRGTAPKPPPSKSPILKTTDLDPSTAKKVPGTTKPEPTKPASNPKTVGFGEKNPQSIGQALLTGSKDKGNLSKSFIKGLGQTLAAGTSSKNSLSRGQTPTKTDPKNPTSTQNKTPTNPGQKSKPADPKPDNPKPKGPTLKKNPSALRMLADTDENYNEIRLGLLDQTPDDNIHGYDTKNNSSPNKSQSNSKLPPNSKTPSNDRLPPNSKTPSNDKLPPRDKTPTKYQMRRGKTMQPETSD